jgi:hypothetical protein
LNSPDISARHKLLEFFKEQKEEHHSAARTLGYGADELMIFPAVVEGSELPKCEERAANHILMDTPPWLERY